MTNLKDLPKQLNEQRLHEMAVAIRKYQDYKIGIAASKLSSNLTLSTRKNYVAGGITYLKEGRKAYGISNALCRALDQVVSECVQPLRPSKEDARRVYTKKFTKRDVTPPIANLDIIKRPLTTKLTYGIKLEDSIKCMPSYDEAVGFLKGIKYMGSAGTLVSFESLEEVK